MTMRPRVLFALLVGSLLLTGCGSSGAGQVSGDAVGAVSLRVSGGIAGVERGIDVSPGGEVFLTRRGGAREPADALTPAESEELSTLVEAVDFGGLPSRSISESSSDRFEYRLQYGGHTLLTDKSEDLGPVDDLISHLDSCMQKRT
ncbi:hypothetical protein [Streptomyces sp. NPDC001741]|uniref:hypothetical protein n=1 Tax=Streptomyces sp. NPDC001741 TaxID=3364605 RepID=UPI00369FF43C